LAFVFRAEGHRPRMKSLPARRSAPDHMPITSAIATKERED
jgi:hypothetical protein